MTSITAGPQKILVVEYDQIVRLLTARMVEDAGYVAVHAGDVDAALVILESRSDIALVLTGIRMHGRMDGLKLVHAIRARWPSIKIIIASAYTRAALSGLPMNSRYFTKPYLLDAIVAEMRLLLAA